MDQKNAKKLAATVDTSTRNFEKLECAHHAQRTKDANKPHHPDDVQAAAAGAIFVEDPCIAHAHDHASCVEDVECMEPLVSDLGVRLRRRPTKHDRRDGRETDARRQAGLK